MDIQLKDYQEAYKKEVADIWNYILEEGNSFSGDVLLSEEEIHEKLSHQTKTVCAFAGEELVGFYYICPNNSGRCSHIANASYAVKKNYRGKGIGRILVKDSLEKASACGFKALQFNAVVVTNLRAIQLYLSLGFQIIGTITKGFRLKDGSYSDMLVMLKQFE